MKNKFLSFSLIALTTTMLGLNSCGVKKPSTDDNTNDNTEVTKEPKLTLTSSKTVIDMGEELELKVELKNLPDAELVWKSSDETVALVDQHGIILAKDVEEDSEVTISVEVKGRTDLKASIKIKVKHVEKDGTVYITSVSENTNFAAHKTNSNLPTTDSDKFIVSNKEHLVGDDNLIDIKPVSIFQEIKNGQLVDSNYNGDWEYKITISVKGEDETFSVIPGNSDLIETIDTKKCTIDFSNKAINKEFKVRLEPTNLTKNQQNDAHYEDKYVANYEFKVIDGYNVYNALDFSVIENRREGIELNIFDRDTLLANAWHTFKTEKGIDTKINPENVILQAPIKITPADIPSEFIYSKDEENVPGENCIGTLKDRYQIYTHHTPNNKTFNLYGNYFTIDAQEIPLIKSDDGKPNMDDAIIIPEAELLRFNPEFYSNKPLEELAATRGIVSDVKFIGNTTKKEANMWSGGLILSNADKMSATYDNVVTTKWYQSFSLNNSPLSDLQIKNCKVTDNYALFVFVRACKDLVIENSTFNSCGGPGLVVQDKVEGNRHEPTDVKLINSSITSFVNGSEGWFQSQGLTPYLMKFNDLNQSMLIPNGKSITAKSKAHPEYPYFNFVCVHMNSKVDLHDIMNGKFAPIKGSITFNDNSKFDILDSEDKNFKGFYDKIFPTGAVMLRSNYAPEESVSKTSYGYTDIASFFRNSDNSDVAKASPLMKGDKLAIYAFGFMLTFDYFAPNQFIEDLTK